MSDTEDDGSQYNRSVADLLRWRALKDLKKSLHSGLLKERGSIQEPTVVHLGGDELNRNIAESDEPGKVSWTLASTKLSMTAMANLEIELLVIGKRVPTRWRCQSLAPTDLNLIRRRSSTPRGKVIFKDCNREQTNSIKQGQSNGMIDWSGWSIRTIYRGTYQFGKNKYYNLIVRCHSFKARRNCVETYHVCRM